MANATRATIDLIRRRIPLAGVVALTALVGLATWGAVSLGLASGDARAASDLRNAYATVRYQAMVERRAVESATSRREISSSAFFAAAAAVGRTLERAPASLGAEQQRRLRVLARTQARALAAGGRYFATLHGGRPARAAVLRRSLENEVTALGSQAYRADGDLHLRSVGLWPGSGLDVAALAAVVVVFGAGLVVGLTWLVRLLGYRRRHRRERVVELERLEQAALTDSLTGLRNHRAFHEDLKEQISVRNRTGLPFSLLMVDMNGLKQINDTHGHQVGDERIRVVGQCLKAALGAEGTGYRVGGDEFMVILPGLRAWAALAIAQQVHREIARARGGVSVGISESTLTESKDTLIKRADLALYEAKRSSRGTVVFSHGLEPQEAPVDEEVHRHHQKLLASALARAVDAKDAGTRNHCETVSELCVLLGQQLGLDPARIEKLRLAGLLHDVGKIGIADSILRKPAVLAEDESEIMRTHAAIGHNIVSAAELDEEAGWVLHHHERIDGTGYPGGLRGEEIPLESRIILVADAFEAITADRPYRRGKSPEEALDELAANAGTQFDHRCVDALSTLFGYADAARHDELERLRSRRKSTNAPRSASPAEARSPA